MSHGTFLREKEVYVCRFIDGFLQDPDLAVEGSRLLVIAEQGTPYPRVIPDSSARGRNCSEAKVSSLEGRLLLLLLGGRCPAAAD